MNATRTILLAGTLLTTTVMIVPLAQAEPRPSASSKVHNADSDARNASEPKESNSPYALTLGEMTFDPVQDPIALPTGWAHSTPDPQGNELRLVQLDGPTQQQTLNALKAQGLEIVQYVHPYTYIVWGDAAARDAAVDVEHVRWTGDLAPAFRVLPQYRNLPAGVIRVDVLMYRGADVDAAVRSFRELGAHIVDRTKLNDKFEVVGFNMSGTIIQQASTIPGVYSIQPMPTSGGLRGEMTDQINLRHDNGLVNPGYQQYLNDIGLSGNGSVVAIVDGGTQDSHPDLVSRMLPCSGQTCGGGASGGHGTHTAGIVAADGSASPTDGNGFLRGLGVAPGASLVEQVYSPWYNDPGGMLLLMRESYENGAFLSSNSWGPSGFPQGYDNDTMQVDIGSRDTDPDAPGDQPLLYVLAFMNGNGGTSTQGSPDEAKNIFTIGSSKAQTGGGAQITAINDISSNSAHGPALDGRKIPHMVAPGCDVDSTYSGSGYGLLCGTSMACPHAAGAVALFLEHYRSLPNYEEDPSPAMVKAAFLPVAWSLAGHDDADGVTLGHPFDSKQGWGRLNLDAVVNPDPNSVRYFDNPTVFDSTGEQWTTNVSPLDPSKPMRIMLVWTDAPGHGMGGSTPAWNNNLDLVVEAGGTYRGNNFGSDGFSVTGGTADGMNNTEGVFLGPTPPGGATIIVNATNINSDGLPNVGDETDQDFAVACYNCAEEPGFLLSADPTSADVCAPATIDVDVQVDSFLGFNDPVTLSANNVPSGVNVSFSENPVTPPADVTATIDVSAATAFNDYTIELAGDSGDLHRTVNFSLSNANTVPEQVMLDSPADGATGVALAPTLTWNQTAQAVEYDVQIATDAAFGNIIYEATVEATSHGVESPLDSLATYYWRVRAANYCGDGPFSAPRSFTTLDAPSILLVDDDDDDPNVRSYYEDMFAALGWDYDVWDTGNTDSNEPDATTLQQYRVVLWFTGEAWIAQSGPGSAGESALASFLDAGGCLFLTSQDYHYENGLTSFMTDYLGVDSIDNDEDQNIVTGTGSVFGSLGTYDLSYPFTNYADTVFEAADAELAFNGDNNGAGVDYDGGNFRTTFLVFPLEAVPDAADRGEIFVAFTDWCDELFQAPCPWDFDGSGGVDVSDLLSLLSTWGACEDCPEDVNDDNIVDVSDLLALLSNWGACPE